MDTITTGPWTQLWLVRGHNYDWSVDTTRTGPWTQLWMICLKTTQIHQNIQIREFTFPSSETWLTEFLMKEIVNPQTNKNKQQERTIKDYREKIAQIPQNIQIIDKTFLLHSNLHFRQWGCAFLEKTNL